MHDLDCTMGTHIRTLDAPYMDVAGICTLHEEDNFDGVQVVADSLGRMMNHH